MVQYGTRYGTALYRMVWYSMVRYSTARYSMVEYGTAWHVTGTLWRTGSEFGKIMPIRPDPSLLGITDPDPYQYYFIQLSNKLSKIGNSCRFTIYF
jgi:hypothetical protein